MSGKGWIGVDLDGTLAHWTEWVGPTEIGPPIPLMVERVKRWLEEGKDVRIFTARVYPGLGFEDRVPQISAAISVWCWEHIGRPLPVTCTKDYEMLELWDDRAVQVVPNTGLRADGRPS